MAPLFEAARSAMARHGEAAREANRIFVGLCGGRRPPRVPGMDTVIRMAIRIECGRTPEQAAAREYVYRWHLALRSPVFGIPHTIGC